MSDRSKNIAAVAALIGLVVAGGFVVGAFAYHQGAASERQLFVPEYTTTQTFTKTFTVQPTTPVDPASLKTEVGPGSYKVGMDIAEGVWFTPGAPGGCYFARHPQSGTPWLIDGVVEGPYRVALQKGEIADFVGCTFKLEP